MSYNGCHKTEWGNIVADDVGLSAETSGFFLAVFLCIVFAVVFIGGAYALSNFECKENAKQMGFDFNFSLVTGCKIKLENGHYIDIDKYRGNGN